MSLSPVVPLARPAGVRSLPVGSGRG